MNHQYQWWKPYKNQVVRPRGIGGKGLIVNEDHDILWSCSHEHRTHLAAFRCASKHLEESEAKKSRHTLKKPRFGWWPPWGMDQPWRLHGWLGTDEYHNPSASIYIPLLGAFHIWFDSWRDDTEGHYSLSPQMDAPTCPVCIWFKYVEDEVPFPKSWWWNPPRPQEP